MDKKLDHKELLKAGVHFGHLTRKWNPKMSEYIFMQNNGIHIIDLHKTIDCAYTAAVSLQNITKSGRKIMFVATKKQAKTYVSEKAKELNMTNQVHFELADYRSIKNKFDRIVSVGAFEHFGKKFYKTFFKKVKNNVSNIDKAIISALEVIPEFQKKNRVQIVNTVFLTDGESHTNSHVWRTNKEGVLDKEYFSCGSRDTYYVDPVSKKTYGSNQRFRRGLTTPIFYQILRDRCKVNILGFYLTGKRFKHICGDLSWGTKGAPSADVIFKQWKKEKSYVASNYLGYDKLYYIKDGEDLNVDNEDFVVTEDASKSQLTKAFKRFTGKKLTNRIVLKSFAEMVA